MSPMLRMLSLVAAVALPAVAATSFAGAAERKPLAKAGADWVKGESAASPGANADDPVTPAAESGSETQDSEPEAQSAATQTETAQPAPRAITSISPIFAEIVSFSLPADFVTKFENNANGRYIREAVLAGESVDTWLQMITVTGTRDQAALPELSPEIYIERMAGGFKRACPDTLSVNALGPARIAGHEAFVAVVGCGTVQKAGYSETTLVVAIKGEKDYYTVQWAERAASTDQAPVNDTKWTERLNTLGPIKVCPIVKGEKAPYRSCIASN